MLDLYAGCWDRQDAGQTRLRDLRRREDEHPGPHPLPPNPRTRLNPDHARRARVRAWRRPRLPRRLGRAPRQRLRALRTDHRHRTIRPPRRTGHDHRALRLGSPRVLGRRQRLQPPRPTRRRPHCSNAGRTPASSNSRSTPPGSTRSRSTSPSCNARSSPPTTSLTSPRSKTGCSPSSDATNRPPTPFEWRFTRGDLAKS